MMLRTKPSLKQLDLTIYDDPHVYFFEQSAKISHIVSVYTTEINLFPVRLRCFQLILRTTITYLGALEPAAILISL